MVTVFENPKKVSFNIASEASYVYILCRQKFIKECQNWFNLASFWKPTKIGEKFKWDIFGWFSNNVIGSGISWSVPRIIYHFFSMMNFFDEQSIFWCIVCNDLYLDCRNVTKRIGRWIIVNPACCAKDNWWKRNGIECRSEMSFGWRTTNLLPQIYFCFHLPSQRDLSTLKRQNLMGIATIILKYN